MRRRPASWEGLAVVLLAVGLAVGVWTLTHRAPSDMSSCQVFSQLHTRNDRVHSDLSSLARVEAVTLTHVPDGGLQVLWQFNQEDPNLGHESVGELEVVIRQSAHDMVLGIPTLGSTAWAEMGQSVNVATAEMRPWEVLVSYSRAQIFELTGSFLWHAGVDYGLIDGAKSSCPRPGSPSVQAG
jgi:hypothetical protein